MKIRVCIHCQATFKKGNKLRQHVRRYHQIPKAKRAVRLYSRRTIVLSKG